MMTTKKQTSSSLRKTAAISHARQAGKIVRLSDPEIAPDIEKRSKKIASDKKAALNFLQSIGVSTKTGRLTKRYGG